MPEYTGILNFAPKKRDPETERLKAEWIAKNGVHKVDARDRIADGKESPKGQTWRSQKASTASAKSRAKTKAKPVRTVTEDERLEITGKQRDEQRRQNLSAAMKASWARRKGRDGEGA